MIYIREKDDKWHDPHEELPPTTTRVMFLFPDGRIIKGEILVDMSGFYAYLRDEGYQGWENLEILKWKFA